MAHTFGTSLSNNECLLDYVNPPMWVPIQRDIGEVMSAGALNNTLLLI